jgi:hypothetical protein
MRLLRAFGLLGAGLTAASLTYAHHGFGTFAMNEDIELSGVVTGIDFVNAHSWLHFEVTQEGGTVVEYRCEMCSATTPRRSGWSPEMVPPSEDLTPVLEPGR